MSEPGINECASCGGSGFKHASPRRALRAPTERAQQAEAVLRINRQVEWAVEDTGLLLALRDGLQRTGRSEEGHTRQLAQRIRYVAGSRVVRWLSRIACTALMRQVMGPRWMCRSGAVVKAWDAAVIEHGGGELVVRILAGNRREVDCVVMFDVALAQGSLLVVSADALLGRWQAG